MHTRKSSYLHNPQVVQFALHPHVHLLHVSHSNRSHTRQGVQVPPSPNDLLAFLPPYRLFTPIPPSTTSAAGWPLLSRRPHPVQVASNAALRPLGRLVPAWIPCRKMLFVSTASRSASAPDAAAGTARARLPRAPSSGRRERNAGAMDRGGTDGRVEWHAC